MKYFILFAFSALSITCFGQEWPSKEFISENNYEKVFPDSTTTVITGVYESPNFTPPMYPGGQQGIINFIKKEIKFPNTKKKPKNGGRVILTYVVNREGNVVDVQIIQSAGEIYDDEAIRVIKKMERWIPAKLSGREINIKYTVPINFF